MLIHAGCSERCRFGANGVQKESGRSRLGKFVGTQQVSQASVRSVPGTDGKFDPDKICHLCRNKGHWKGECPLSKREQRSNGSVRSVYAKSAGFVASASSFGDQMWPCRQATGGPREVDESYAPFMKDGFVSKGEKKPVRILRDTGASQSFVLEGVLPFSPGSDTGDRTPVLGISLVPVSVPLHRLNLFSDLVEGEVVIWVRRA